MDRRSINAPDNNLPRVAVLPSDRSACGFYRVLQPLRLLHEQGKIQLLLHEYDDGRFGIHPGMKFDVWVVQKPGGALYPGDEMEEAFLGDVKRNGPRVVYEVDDDLERVPKENPVQKPSSFPGYIARTRELIRACRLVTTTTPYAAENLRRVHPEVRVVPNGVDWKLWARRHGDRLCDGPQCLTCGGVAPLAPRRPGVDDLRLVWAASPNHVEDARLLIGPFRELFRKYGHIKLVLAGGRFPQLEAALPASRVEYAGAVADINDWPGFARLLRPDIWLAPLVDSKFARSKSNLKWLEGTALMVPVVASDVEPYRADPDGEMLPCARVRTTREWVQALSLLIESAEHRAFLAAEAFHVAGQHYTAQHSADAWMRVIDEVARCP